MRAGLAALALSLLACRSAAVDDHGTAELDATATEATATETGTDAGPSSDDASAAEGFVPVDGDLPDRCDVWQQDCPEGEKCVPYASASGHWAAWKCVLVTGAQPPGEPCVYGGVVEATDDCDATSICMYTQEVDGQLVGECVAQCAGTADVPVCPPMTECRVPGSGVPALCIPVCDPLAQDCAAGLACYWNHSSFTCISSDGDLEPGQPCGFINDCAAGLLCIDADSVPDCADASCCTPYCSLAGDQACAAVPGTTCVPFFQEGMASPGYEELGVCAAR